MLAYPWALHDDWAGAVAEGASLEGVHHQEEGAKLPVLMDWAAILMYFDSD